MSARGVFAGVLLFWAMMIFEVSVLPDSLGLGLAARVVNATALVVLFAYGLGVLVGGLPERVLVLYCCPVMLVVVGFLVNILRSASPETLSHLGLLLPWAAALSVPFMPGHDPERYWRLFYRFMLVASLVALIEYAAVFSGWLAPTVIETKRGDFLKGVFTIFHGLEDDTVYYRMYGVFAEPGTFAMYLLPALAYALIHRKMIATASLLACLVLTASLGGYFGFAIMLASFLHWELRRRSAVAQLIVGLGAIVVMALTAGALYEFFSVSYLDKGVSAGTRESNLSLFFTNFFEILSRAPLGMDLKGESLSNLADTDKAYIGSNFAPGTALMIGGVTAFLGYTIFLTVSTVCWLKILIRKSDHRVFAYVCVSFPALMTFVFQRTTIYESAVYSFLFAAPLLATLRRRFSCGTQSPLTVARETTH